MAYWLDPNHNPLPNPFNRGFNSNGSLRREWPDDTVGEEKPGIGLPIPASLKRAIAGDEHDVLSVEVADADVESLRELINALDQPLRRIEIEAMFVEIDKADLKNFGVDIASNKDNSIAQVGFVSNNFPSRLNEMVAQNKVSIISAPRVNAVDNVIAQLGSSTMSRILPQLNVAQTEFEFPMNKIWLNIKPTINPDNSLTLLYRSFRQSSPNAVEKVSQGQVGGLSDGNTFAIREPLPDNKFATKSMRQSVIFVTARIVREGK